MTPHDDPPAAVGLSANECDRLLNVAWGWVASEAQINRALLVADDFHDLVRHVYAAAQASAPQVPREQAALIIALFAGYASMCWEPKPTGIFASERCSQAVDDALDKLYPVPAAAAAVAEPKYCRQHGGDGKRGRACPECLRYELSQRLPNHPDAAPEPAPAATGDLVRRLREPIPWSGGADDWLRVPAIHARVIDEQREYAADRIEAYAARIAELEARPDQVDHKNRAIRAEYDRDKAEAARDQAVALLREITATGGNYPAMNAARAFLAQADAKGSKGSKGAG